MTNTGSPNQHIIQYLDYYAQASPPVGFALMLNGPWGVGKTHLIRSYFANDAKGGATVAYLSLYGVSNPDEMRRALFAAVYPIVAGKTGEFFGSIGKSMLGLVNLKTDVDLRDFMVIQKDTMIVVDDLERCSMSIKDVLGYLNCLLELDRHKLIIIGNDDEFDELERTEFKQSQEKVIGQILTVRPDFEEAYTQFAGRLGNSEFCKILDREKAKVLALFSDSKFKNLRALNQALLQFERLFECLSTEQKEKPDHIAELLLFVLAYSLECQTGEILRSDLENRRPSLANEIALRNGNEAIDASAYEKLRRINGKYIAIDLDRRYITDELLIQILFDGFYDTTRIRDELDTRLFGDDASEEPWRTVWWGFLREPRDFEVAKEEMLRSLEMNEYREPEVLLHVLMLRCWLAEIGYLNEDTKTLIAQGKAYIDGVFQGETPILLEPGATPEELLSNTAGLGFRNVESAEFREISAYLIDAVKQDIAARSKQWSDELVNIMRSDPEKFYREVCYTADGSGIYLRVPILHNIPVIDFLDIALSQDRKDENIIFRALVARYEYGNWDKGLSLEKTWLEELRGELLRRAQDANGIERVQLNRFDKLCFGKILDRA